MELDHAKRSLLQTTFSPIEFNTQEGTPARPDPVRPAAERAAPLRMFKRTEVAAVLQSTTEPQQRAILEALNSSDPAAVITAVHNHDSPEGKTVPALLSLLARERRNRVVGAEKAVRSWIERAEERISASVVEGALAQIKAAQADDTKLIERGGGSADAAFAFSSAEQGIHPTEQGASSMQATTTPRTPQGGGGGGEGVTKTTALEGLAERLQAAVDARLHGPCTLGGRLRSVLASGQCPDEELSDSLFVLGVAAPEQLDAALDQWKVWAGHSDKLPELSPAFEVQPIGYLHLERLNFLPAGVEHGELIYSLPLAPGEQVAIAHKEWSNTEEEFQKVVSDSFEDYSEQGVVNTTDMAQSTTAQRTHATAFNLSVSLSGGYGPVSGTISSSYSAEQSSSDSTQNSLNHTQNITRKASARAKKEHKLSFRLAKKTQEEDQTTRIVRNPDPFNPVRFDYYQLMRRWRVDLRRYGVRLTYDLTIPEPAYDLLDRYAEIEELTARIEEGFELDMNPSDVNRANWVHYATKYGASIDPPPPLMISVQAMKLSTYPPEQKDLGHLDEMHITPPEGYKYAGMSSAQWQTYYADSEGAPEISLEYVHGDPGVTADIGFTVFGDNIGSILSSVRVWFALQEDVERAWRVKAYQAIREAASKDYDEKRQMLEERRKRLLAELAEVDALTLRKLEREELMKGTLRFLFGPALRFSPDGVPDSYFDSNGVIISEETQATVLEHGALLSFLHQAIEWENINSFLYPYFWTPRKRWSQRLRLRHNDAIHEAFLRAGAARVVLPIRPGWEKAFLSVLKTGKVDGLDGTDDIYLTIAEEIQNYAKTTYPGITPANSDDIDPEKATRQAEGVLIGSWYEYTPTGATDIKIGESGPTEGEYQASAFNPVAPWAKMSQLIDAATDVLKALSAKLTPKQP